MAELDRIINVFCNVSPALCTVNSIHHKAKFLQKPINAFHGVNLTLLTIASEKG